MTLRQLEVFLAVAREKSFSLAAKKIHSSQPTLSEHISELENELGKQLFFRRGRHRVVTVTEDTPVGDIARLLEERRIKRVPVVRRGALVGIVSRADLLRGLASSKARPPRTAPTSDRAIRDKLTRRLAKEPWAPLGQLNVIVTDGVVHLWGLVDSPEQRRALEIAAREIDGVRRVEDHLGEVPLYLRGT